MARCFPFPPSGYAGKYSSNDALIVSIKLQEERVNSVPDRVRETVKSSDTKKDRKKEKKEKKKNQKNRKRDEKVKSHFPVESEKLKHNVKEEFKGKQSIEALERSNLTEEHGRPVDPQNVSCSSDSTGNSSKRKRYSSPAISIRGNGNIIRIRLSSQKRDDPSMSGSIPCLLHSTSESNLRSWSRPELSISQKDVMPKVQESSMGQKDVLPNIQESLHAASTSTPREDPTSSGRIETREPTPSNKLSSYEKKMLKRESIDKKLFENFVPLELESELVVHRDDEDDWLFGKKDEEGPAKRLRGGSDNVDNLPCSASALLQPRAHFLTDVGVYALPFTVPF